MFSPALEIVLTVAYREATARRHTHLTLEHLLYALAHDPDGERILTACGADMPQLRRDLDKYLQDSVEQFARGQQKEPEQTLAFRRVLQTAVLHVQSAGRQEVHSGDVIAATLQQNRSHAAQLLSGQGITRLDVLEYITHGKTKLPPSSPGGPDTGEAASDAEAGGGDRGTATARDPLSAYATDLTARARAGELDPLIGRTDELQRTMEILCRRRKNNPVFVGDAGVGKTALAEGLATRLLDDDVPDLLEGAEVFSLDTGALLAGTRFRGDFEERFKAVIHALSKRPMPILFIDEIHSTVGAGATTGGTMDLATLIKPILTTGQLRLVGSTTHEEFKHIEKDRALARRLQKIVIDEPSIQETVQILQGLAHALRRAPSRALRRRRDRSRGQARRAPPARLQAARQRHRRARRGRREEPHEAQHGSEPAGGDRPRHAGRADRDFGREHRGSRRAHGQDSGQAGVLLRPRSPALARGVARARRLWPGRSRRHRRAGDQARTRRAGPARSSGRVLPLHRADRRRQDRARQAAGAAPRQRVPALRHERVHGEARRRAVDRRASRLRRVRAGRPARRRGPAASLRGRAPRRDREGARRHLQHPAAGHGPRDADRQQRPQGGLPAGRADHDVERRLARDERRQHRLLRVRHDTARPGRPAEGVAAALEAGDREGLQPRIPQPARRHRLVRAADAGGDGDDRREVHPAARGAARRAARGHQPRARGQDVARREGLRPHLRRASRSRA